MQKLFRIGIWVAVLAALSDSAFAQQNEYSVKAAFLVNFLKFIEWPDKSGPYVIEVAGKNPFGTYLESLAKKTTINGRKVIVTSGKPPNGLVPSILFVPISEQERFGDYIQPSGRPTIVIGEAPGFAKKYGAVNFVVDRERVAFEINQKLSKPSGVKISSRLLQLAKLVN
jgi:YfiR/HmsC-like